MAQQPVMASELAGALLARHGRGLTAGTDGGGAGGEAGGDTGGSASGGSDRRVGRGWR